MTTREQQIEQIRQKCIDAHDVEGSPRVGDKSGAVVYEFLYENRPVRLADVLLVMENKFTEAGVFTKSPYYEAFGQITEQWNFRKDDLAEQSDELLFFLTKAL